MTIQGPKLKMWLNLEFEQWKADAESTIIRGRRPKMVEFGRVSDHWWADDTTIYGRTLLYLQEPACYFPAPRRVAMVLGAMVYNTFTELYSDAAMIDMTQEIRIYIRVSI